MANDEAKSFFQLAQILATVAGFFIVATGIFYSLSYQTQFESYTLQKDILLNEMQNESDLSIKNSTNLSLSKYAQTLENKGFLFYASGIFCIFLSILSWIYGYEKIKDKDMKLRDFLRIKNN